jgi:hypothetical protein
VHNFGSDFEGQESLRPIKDDKLINLDELNPSYAKLIPYPKVQNGGIQDGGSWLEITVFFSEIFDFREKFIW